RRGPRRRARRHRRAALRHPASRSPRRGAAARRVGRVVRLARSAVRRAPRGARWSRAGPGSAGHRPHPQPARVRVAPRPRRHPSARPVSPRRSKSNGDYESLVREHYQRLSPAHRRVADYLLADGRRAALEPIATVAKNLRTSESTVVRFAQTLGYKGYPELRDQLRERFLATATSLDRLAARAAGPKTKGGELLERVLAEDADSIMRTLAQVPRETFDA